MPEMDTINRRIIITPGEPAGIGGEILVDAAYHNSCPLLTIDDPLRLRAIAKAKGLRLDIESVGSAKEAAALPPKTLAVMPIKWRQAVVAGKPDSCNAQQVIKAIDDAVSLAKNGDVSAIVTNPIQKSSLYAAGFTSPGHTEYLGLLDDAYPVMMLACEGLRTVPLTIHMPLNDVAHAITQESIIRTALVVEAALRQDFGIKTPRIMVAGLNPHAGEGGSLGREEIDTIAPAIAKLQARGMGISGPVSADTLFHEERRRDYDAVIGMYHDQMLIPVKMLDFHKGVNVTLGLSFIRTSPDHGTALDQAGSLTANPQSLMAAIEMAEAMAKRRGR